MTKVDFNNGATTTPRGTFVFRGAGQDSIGGFPALVNFETDNSVSFPFVVTDPSQPGKWFSMFLDGVQSVISDESNNEIVFLTTAFNGHSSGLMLEAGNSETGDVSVYAPAFVPTFDNGCELGTNSFRWSSLNVAGKIKAATANISALPVFANNAAALAGGLVAGDFYRSGADPDPIYVVH